MNDTASTGSGSPSRKAVWPAAIAQLPYPIPWARGVLHDDLVWVCGVGGKPGGGVDEFASTLEQQIRDALGCVDAILSEFGAGRREIFHLVLFYRNDGDADEERLRRLLAEEYGGRAPVLSFVPCTHFAPTGMLVEIDAYATRPGSVPAEFRTLNVGTPAELTAARVGDLVVTGTVTPRADDGALLGAGDHFAQTEAALERLARLLALHGVGPDRVVKLNTYVVGGASDSDAAAAWRATAEARAARFPGRGPTISDLVLATLHPRGTLVACSAWAWAGAEQPTCVDPPQHAGWPGGFRFPQAVRCGRYVFLSGQRAADGDGRVLHPGDVQAQTREAMRQLQRALEACGLGIANLLRINAHYAGPSGWDELKLNIVERARFFPAPPRLSPTVATGVPQRRLCLPGQRFEIEAIAGSDAVPEG